MLSFREGTKYLLLRDSCLLGLFFCFALAGQDARTFHVIQIFVFKIEINGYEIKVAEIYYWRLMEAKFESTVCERDGEVKVINMSSMYEQSIQYNGGTYLMKKYP